MNMRSTNGQKGAVLIFVLWVLSFLAVLAVNLGYGVRQKMTFMKRIESRSQAQHVVEGGVKVAVTLLLNDLQRNQFQYTAAAKTFRHNNPSRFADIRMEDGSCEVSYPVGTPSTSQDRMFGVIDEESKINVNTADKLTLQSIISQVLVVDDNYAEKLAESIYDWRQLGDSEIKGFTGDDYYSNLKFPYPKKSLPFEMPDELLLIKGMDRAKYEILRNFVTVYGNGQVNVNTASKQVLIALGLNETVADKILAQRRGPDGVDNTADDHMFYRTFDIATEVNAYAKMEDAEMRMIDSLNQRGVLGTNSYYFTVNCLAFLKGTNEKRRAVVTFSSTDNRIVYWNEK
ncbi:MAG: general secretion pathway protein GspK [Candidatus Omnitrophica bacterium]|nr:general secretion pathway protein GspK [Candidatus Omnitrophota bacterium]